MTELSPQIAGCVPIPNRLFDEVLPTLTDSELRVLLVVMRSTLGWREGSDRGGWRYKRRDWITHGQLIKRTGRSSASVSAAIQKLVAASLIVVEDTHGNPLDTPEKRRLSMGRLYFGLGDKWKTARISRNEKLSTTTNSWNNIKRETAAVDNMRVPNRARQGFARVSDVLEAHPAERRA